MKNKKNKIKINMNEPKYFQKHCKRCGCLEIEELSDGTILCKNKYCLAVNIPNGEGDYDIELK